MPQKAAIIDTLPDDLREKVEQDVRAGDFSTADEAIRQAILFQHERLALRRSLIEAKAQIARGEFVTAEQSHADIDELARTLSK
jgi:Arc/MetJ-type ribon-helix-helix transcriptional regulator